METQRNDSLLVDFPPLALDVYSTGPARMTSQAHIPTYHYSQMTWTEPPEPLLGPSNLATSPTPFDPLPPPVAPTIGVATTIENPLYLSIDSGVRRVKACVLDKDLKVVWTDQVELDTDLAKYGCAARSWHAFGSFRT